MAQMNHQHAVQLIAPRIISNAIIQSVFTNLLCVTEKMTVGMEVMNLQSMRVVLQTLYVSQVFGHVQDFQMFASTKERFVTTNQIVQMEQMKGLFVTMLIVIIIEVNVLMGVSKHLSELFVPALQEKC